MAGLLDIRNLNVRFTTRDGEVAAVTDLSLSLAPGECLGVVGESGSGKSQAFLAALGLLAENGRASGQVVFHEQDLLTASDRQLARIRGNKIAMIFQDPMTALTPHMKIGRQLAEVLLRHRGMTAKAARGQAEDMLARVHMPDPAHRLDMYPHELSGGLRQRVMIAMALLCEPEVIVADEPTTALNVTVQAQILSLIREIKGRNTAIVLITHDFGVIAGLADRVAVMYAGRLVEEGPVRDIFATACHPYTRGLIACTPRLDAPLQGHLATIAGQPPNLQRLPAGCAFLPRCPVARDDCAAAPPPLRARGQDRAAACVRDDVGAWS